MALIALEYPAENCKRGGTCPSFPLKTRGGMFSYTFLLFLNANAIQMSYNQKHIRIHRALPLLSYRPYQQYQWSVRVALKPAKNNEYKMICKD